LEAGETSARKSIQIWVSNNLIKGLAWLGLAWLGLAWLGLAWLGLAWLGLAWLGLAKLICWLGLPEYQSDPFIIMMQ
jgi:hypothetical protein